MSVAGKQDKVRALEVVVAVVVVAVEAEELLLARNDTIRTS